MVVVRWAPNGVSIPVPFVVDTGAFDMTLSQNDAAELGASVEDMPESDSAIMGIGGEARSFDMEGVSMTFVGEDDRTLTISPERVRVMGYPVCDSCEDELAYAPSLMGRRFMEEHGFTLFWDFPRRVAVLEIE